MLNQMILNNRSILSSECHIETHHGDLGIKAFLSLCWNNSPLTDSSATWFLHCSASSLSSHSWTKTGESRFGSSSLNNQKENSIRYAQILIQRTTLIKHYKICFLYIISAGEDWVACTGALLFSAIFMLKKNILGYFRIYCYKPNGIKLNIH